jgi:PASTA domain
LHDYLFATAAGFDSGGALAPDVVGTSIDQARTIASKAGFQFNSIEQEPDDAVAPDTILLQSPPAHHGGLNNNLRFLDLIVSSPATAAACTAANLVVYYDGSEGGGGMQFGGLVIRNLGPTECQLRVPISLVGLDAAGHIITNALHYEIAPDTILTPRAPPVPPGVNPPAGVFLGRVPVISDPRDGNGPDGLCETVITPATWRLLIGAATRDIPNRVPPNPSLNTAGLPTCQGTITSMTVMAYSSAA